IDSYISVVISPFLPLLEGGNFVQSSFGLSSEVKLSVPCQIRADVLFGVASIAARLIPQARGEFRALIGLTDTDPTVKAFLGLYLDLSFEVEACLLFALCYTLPRIDIFKDVELVEAGEKGIVMPDCKDPKGGEVEPPRPAAPAGQGGDVQI